MQNFQLPTRWTPDDKRFFEMLYRQYVQNQNALNCHPEAPKLTPSQWTTIAHNMAWVGTEAHRGHWFFLPDGEL